MATRTVWCGTPLSKKSTAKDGRKAASEITSVSPFRAASNRRANFGFRTLGARTDEQGLSRQDKYRLHWRDGSAAVYGVSKPMPGPEAQAATVWGIS